MVRDRGHRDSRGSPKRTFAPSRGHATRARLEVIRGGTHLTVQAAEIDELCRAVFAGATPKTAAADEQVTIEYPRFTLAGLLRPARRADIDLNCALAWTFTFAGGIGDSTMDLRGLGVTRFEVADGANNLRLVLPPPQGNVLVHIEGGASALTLLRPADVPAALWVAGGVSRLNFDGDRYGTIGAEARLESHRRGHGHHPDLYEIEILGGGTDLTITEVGR